MNPEEVLIMLKSRSSVRCQKSLDAIFAICDEQVKKGVMDFSYAAIARLGADKGVPKAQSIRNKSGEPYRALIQSFIDSHNKIKQRREVTKVDGWIDEIVDPKLKLLVSVQAAQLKEAKKMLKEIIPPGTEILVDDRKGVLSDHRLSELERDALEHLLSEDFLRDWNLSVGHRGDVVDLDGSKIFKVATVDALKKALRFL